jgi:ferric-dicitrate binding protein FerR (iron transport regulator)
MTLTPEPPRPHRPRRRRLLRALAVAAGVLVAFGLGVALGQALHDNPKPGGTRTVDRPITLTVEPETITVTTAP